MILGADASGLPSASFIRWLDEGDRLYARFEILAQRVISFASTRFLGHCEDVQTIAKRLRDVRSRCDTIDYDVPGTVEAYALLHFLDRYHRFQLILSRLVDLGHLPVKKLPIDILDVGTGPGPSLFAISDMYSWIIAYGLETENKLLGELRFNMDYVENSQRFRQWLHHFTEHANFADQRVIPEWRIPYHFGSFQDFAGLDFSKAKNEFLESQIAAIEREFDDAGEAIPSRAYIIDNYMNTEWKNALRYDLIIFSNFLTSAKQARDLHDELRSAANALRNNGIIIIVGGRGEKYAEVYSTVRSIVCGDLYRKKKSISRLSEITAEVMRYEYHGRVGDLLREIRQVLVRRIEDCGASGAVHPDIFKSLIRSQQRVKGSQKWAIRVFRKQSWPRKKTKRSRIR